MTTAVQHTAGWGDGTPIPGTPFTEVITGAQTAGRLVVLAAEMPVGLRVPEHVHDDADQICIVVTGRVGGSIDGVEHVAGPRTGGLHAVRLRAGRLELRCPTVTSGEDGREVVASTPSSLGNALRAGGS
jgi:hypothetical protein